MKRRWVAAERSWRRAGDTSEERKSRKNEKNAIWKRWKLNMKMLRIPATRRCQSETNLIVFHGHSAPLLERRSRWVKDFSTAWTMVGRVFTLINFDEICVVFSWYGNIFSKGFTSDNMIFTSNFFSAHHITAPQFLALDYILRVILCSFSLIAAPSLEWDEMRERKFSSC